jgi:hypothetical protein
VQLAKALRRDGGCRFEAFEAKNDKKIEDLINNARAIPNEMLVLLYEASLK